MKIRFMLSILLGIVLLWIQVLPAHADGIIIPNPPPCPGGDCPIEPFPLAQLQIKYHRVDVIIQNQVAITHVDQVFYNPFDWEIEGTYIFPIPVDAVVTDFVLWVDGQPVEGKVLSADEARTIYEETVYRQRDPALLEYIGRGAVQASIYPIPPRGERRIELRYSQVLTAENGLVQYVYPLNTEKFSTKPLDEVSVTVEVRSDQPIRAVYSPSHSVGINLQDDGSVKASYEDNAVLPDADFVLYYSIGENEAFHLMSYRDPGEPTDTDGFFLLLLAPKPGETPQVIAKDVILVLDRSGSMEGEKFEQAQTAARFILQHLNPEDHFGLVSFSSGVESYSANLRPAGEKDGAIAWLDQMSALGSTDINRALLEAVSMVSGERPAYLIFLTDGLPTQGETDSDDILNNLAMAASADIRLFAFGVGYDVDTILLDTLAQEHHGRSTYVTPGEALDEIVSAFYTSISTPVLTNLELDFGGMSTYDIYPNPIPDLFEGSQIVVTGRYRQGGVFDVTLSGEVNHQKRQYVFKGQEFSMDSRKNPDASITTIPRLWATRKIGYLLNSIRLNGIDQETIDQIVKLSIRYGIVTPYTSYLVSEDFLLGASAQETLSENTYRDQASAPAEPAYGQSAVDKAATQGELERSNAAIQIDESARQFVRVIGSRTFVRSNGIWVDTAFDPDSMQTQKVAFLSEDYFRLVRSRSDLAAAFALGEYVIALSGGIPYEVVNEGMTTEPLAVTPFAQKTPGVDMVSTPEATKKSAQTAGTVCPAAFMPLIVIFGGLLLRRKSKAI